MEVGVDVDHDFHMKSLTGDVAAVLFELAHVRRSSSILYGLRRYFPIVDLLVIQIDLPRRLIRH